MIGSPGGVDDQINKPMASDRLHIVFYQDGAEVADWRVDGEGMTSGSALGLENHAIESDFDYEALAALLDEK